MIYEKSIDERTFNSEREILYKILFDMKNDLNDLKSLVAEIMQKGVESSEVRQNHAQTIKRLYEEAEINGSGDIPQNISIKKADESIQDTEEIIEESLSLAEKEKELITRALERHNGKRKYAAEELGISERTLYRKIKEYNLAL